MKYVKVYDALENEMFQAAVSDETAGKLLAAGTGEISDVPFEGIPIKSRLRSERQRQREEKPK